MTIDEILGFLNQWIDTFGGVVDVFSVPLKDIIPDFMEIIFTDYILNMTLLGLMFNVGFASFIAYTLWGWYKRSSGVS